MSGNLLDATQEINLKEEMSGNSELKAFVDDKAYHLKKLKLQKNGQNGTTKEQMKQLQRATYHQQRITTLELNRMSVKQKNILNQHLNVLNDGTDNSNPDCCQRNI